MTIKTFIAIPMLISIFALGGCSQNQNDKGSGAIGSRGGGTSKSHAGGRSSKGGSGSGTQSGTIGRGGASGVNSRNGSGRGGAGRGGAGRGGANGGGGGNSANNTSDITLAGLNDPHNLLSQRIIYFDYDKASIRPEYMVLINTHAQLLAKYPNLRMRLEGHADERGSREYNVALSEARAQSVKSIMAIEGVGGQIKTIGYGEELPVATGHDQKSWQKNRRVEIKYEGY